jgi:hypothetical protein
VLWSAWARWPQANRRPQPGRDKVRAFRASVVLLAGRLAEPATTGQHLHLVPSPDPDA